MEFHNIANIFPLMTGDEYEALRNDIAANGLLEPIWTYQGKIIDGRNRYRACLEVGIEPEYREWSGGKPLAFVISMNLHRRHLTPSQCAAVGVNIKHWLQIENPQGRPTLEEQNNVGNISYNNGKQNRDLAGEIVGVSGRYIDDAEKYAKQEPALFEQLLSGEVTLQDAKRETRKQERFENLVTINANNKPLNGDIGKFNVIYADPPWQYEHPISDSRRIENQYPTLSLDEICKLPVQEICEDDAILFLWASTPMLKNALQVMEAWGFEYRTGMVWVKPSIGPGQWVRQRHEHLLIGIRGNIPTPYSNGKPDSVVEAPREGHSQKPTVFYSIIEQMYPSLSKKELFCRKLREGWAAWGNQV